MKFSHVNKFGNRIEWEVADEDVREFIIYLLEDSLVKKGIGDVYQEIDGEWVKLDYYNPILGNTYDRA